jgi:hypothetical protein
MLQVYLEKSDEAVPFCQKEMVQKAYNILKGSAKIICPLRGTDSATA